MELGHSLRDAGFPVREVVQDTDGEAPNARDVLGTVPCANAATLLIEVPVADLVTTDFDGPVAATDFEEALWPGLFARAAGDSESGFERSLLAFFVDHLALDQEDLADVREVDTGMERGTAPNPSGFDSSMVSG